MRAWILAAVALLPLGLVLPAGADHIQPGFNLNMWCSYLSPQERGCTHTETLNNRHIHWFGVTPRLGVSMPDDSVITVSISGINAFGGMPFAASRTCDLGLNVYTPQPSTPLYGVNQRLINLVGDLSIHESCRVDIHTNFLGQVTLTVQGGEGFLAFIDAWVALL